jgi:hypothetical protein
VGIHPHRTDLGGRIELAQKVGEVLVGCVTGRGNLRDAEQAALGMGVPDTGGWLGLPDEVELAAVKPVGDDAVKKRIEGELGGLPLGFGE